MVHCVYDCGFFTAIKCPKLKDVPNGKVELRGNTVNSIAVYTCSEGYTLNGYQQRECNKDGEWAGSPPTCQLTSKGTVCS